MIRSKSWLVAALAAVLVLAVACDRDKKQNQKDAAVAQTALPSGAAATANGPAGPDRVIAADCLKGLTSYRFGGKVAALLPAGSGGGMINALGDITFAGDVVAPDRSRTKLDVSGQSFEVITIGADSWTRFGAVPWTKSSDAPPELGFTPDSICRASLTNLNDPGNRPTEERLNGVDTLRYEFDREAIAQGGGLFGGNDGGAFLRGLPDNTRMMVWVTPKERWPLKVTINGRQKTASEETFVAIEFTLTDLNKSDIKVTPPA